MDLPNFARHLILQFIIFLEKLGFYCTTKLCMVILKVNIYMLSKNISQLEIEL